MYRTQIYLAIHQLCPSIHCAELFHVSPTIAFSVGLFGAQNQQLLNPPVQQSLVEAPPKYALERVIPVAGRQGIACDGEFYYVSGSTSLYKYTKEGELVAKEENPFKVYADVAANHIGDIDVFENELYLSIEWFVDGQGKDIQIAIHDADTLQFKTVLSL